MKHAPDGATGLRCAGYHKETKNHKGHKEETGT